MGKKYNEVNMNDLLENTAIKTKEYNDKQEYYEEEKTYFQMFHDNAESIVKSTATTSRYTSDESTGVLILDIGSKKIDITNYTEADYKSLSDDVSHDLAVKEIIDTVKNDPSLSDLNNRLLNRGIEVDTDRGYASISYTGDNETLPMGDLIFSIEAKEDSYGSLNNKDGISYMSWSSTTNEGVSHKGLRDGLEDTQSYLQRLEAEAALEIDEPEQKSTSSFRP